MENSQLLNWPSAIERTQPDVRERCTKFETGIRRTRSDIETEMSRMEVDEWRIEDVSGSGGDPGVVIRWRDGGNEYAAACDAYKNKRSNIREAYLWVNETRMREKRPVQTAEDSFAAARLPSGEAVAMGEEPAHEVLGVEPGASDAEVTEAFREKAKGSHADAGGSDEEMQRLLAARDQMTGGNDV